MITFIESIFYKDWKYMCKMNIDHHKKDNVECIFCKKDWKVSIKFIKIKSVIYYSG